MFIPFSTDRPQRRLPLMNIALIAANIIIFLIGESLALQSPDRNIRAAGIPAQWFKFMLDPRGIYDPTGPHLYQFITYQFLHEGITHVGFNMLFLWVFGNNLNEKLGNIGYLAFYLAGGVLAGCGQVLTSNAPTLGASGAISAITGLFLVLLPRIHIRMFIWFIIYVDIWEIPSMYFILFKVGQDIYEQLAPGGANVAYMAHISGTLAGALIGLVLLSTKLVQRDHYDLLAMLSRFRRRQEYRAIVARGYDPFNATRSGSVSAMSPFHKETLPAQGPDPRIASLRAEISRLLRIHEIPDATQRYLELRAIDPAQVLPYQEQLDIANQLMAERRYPEAAAAYEDYLRVYPTGPQQDQISLILGLIYSRYFSRPERAKEIFKGVLPRLHNEAERNMALAELKFLESAPGTA